MDGHAGGSGGSGGRTSPLFRRESAKRGLGGMADHRDSSPDTLFVTQDHHYNNEHAAQRQRLSASRTALPPQRYLGDGLDYRRPVMSGSGSNTNSTGQAQTAGVGVIDLTSEDEFPRTTAPTGEARRGPRFGRNIIDLADEDDAEDNTRRLSHDPPMRAIPPARRPNYMDLFPPRAPTRTHPHPQFSNLRRPERASPPPRRTEPRMADPRRRTDMEELPGLPRRLGDDLRSRLRAGDRADNENTRGPRSVTPYPNTHPEPIDLTGDDDDVMLMDARTRAGVNAEPPSTTAGAGTRSSVNDIFMGLNAGTGRLYDRVMAFTGIARTHAHPTLGRAHVAFANPHAHPPGAFVVDLDFGAPAFDMGFGGNQPPPPKYQPPPEAAKGFTRSPGEDDVVVCPKCGDELAVNDDEKKAEVWVIKKCGHAYCGDCAQHRAKSTKGKGKAPAHSKPIPFKECVVSGCSEKVVGVKAMMHIFISS